LINWIIDLKKLPRMQEKEKESGRGEGREDGEYTRDVKSWEGLAKSNGSVRRLEQRNEGLKCNV
jgi:hypothetical protein